MNIDLAGLIPAVVTPMHEDGAVDEASLRRYIEWLLGFDGLKALAVNMDTGEGPQLTREERRHVLEIYSEELGGRLPVLAGIGAPNTQLAVALAEDAAAAGAAGMVLFQLQPALGGVIFSREALLKLIEIPNVVAIKEASFDAVRFVETARVLDEAPRRIQLLTGNDNFILESFVLGADGALIGFGTLAIAEQIEMIEKHRSGDTTGARQIYEDTVQPLVSAVFASPVRDYRARTKEALVGLGVLDAAQMRPPLLNLSDVERKSVRQAVREANLSIPEAANL
jgi:4-hydroxy-tetrahydrodipicolinate synthase